MLTATTSIRSAQTDQRLLAAARKCLLADGVEGLSMRAIAVEAGVTVGAIYRHYPSKEVLVDRVIEESFARYQDALWKDVASLPVGSWQRIVHLGEAYIRFGVENPEDFKVLFTPRANGPRKVSEIHGERSYLAMRQCLIEAIAAGEIRDEDPDLLTFYLLSRVHGIVMLLMACDFSDRLSQAKRKNAAVTLFKETSRFVVEGLRPKGKAHA